MADKKNDKRLTYNRFLTVPFQSGSIVASSMEILDENTSEFLHSHLEYEIYYCLNGEMHLRVEEKILTLGTSDFVLIKPDIMHGVVDEPHLKKEYFICIFQPVYLQNKETPVFEDSFFTFLRYLVDREENTIEHDNREAYEIIEEMDKAYQARSFAWELTLRSLILHFILRLMENFSVPEKIRRAETSDGENPAILIDRYIHDNYSHDISLQDAAKYLHMTPRNVNRILQKYYGKSFQKCLVIIRLGRAKKYLIETNYSIEKIAELVGLSTQSLFRAFRQNEGENPNEYRMKYSQLLGGISGEPEQS